ncbi:MAG: sensor histidine kinase [Trebonia sp.]
MPALLRLRLRALRFPRRTIRLRLTLFYSGLFLVSGAALMAITYLLVRFFPAAFVHVHSARTAGTGGSRPVSPLAPLPSLAALGAQDARQRAADLHQLLVVSGIALVVMALASVISGWLVAGRALRPLRTITAAARDLSSTDLHRRIGLTGPDDELKELGDTFDGLLGRLERSFQSQRQFVANASHELRTPLTLERALLEAVLTDPELGSESLQATCERLLAVNTQHGRLIDALLTLATSDRGIERWEPVDLAALTGHAIASRRAEAGRLGLRVEASLDPARTAGDRALAGRLIANLLDNALRYNVPGGLVEVRTSTHTTEVMVRVGNTGHAVPASEVSELFQPFRRLGRERTRHGDSHGLGLSIVSAIATAHHAAVEASARPGGGLDIEIRFPVVPAGNELLMSDAPRARPPGIFNPGQG